jgi:hypothetical protein
VTSEASTARVRIVAPAPSPSTSGESTSHGSGDNNGTSTTGSNLEPVVGLGVALLLIGGLVLVAGRRRGRRA